MKKLFCKLLILVLAVGCANLWQTAEALHRLENGIIRLHITANSDSLADQTQKLVIRDAVLQHGLPGGSADECYAALQERLPEIEQIASDALKQAGGHASVRAALAEEDFPARQYGEITLPAGRYRALRITIGEGTGQNWWCVMFPSLCLPAASEQSVIAQSVDEDAAALTAEPEQYEIRLKFLDLLRAVRKRLAQVFSQFCG